MAVERIDCMYEACPIPLIKALKKLENMAIGDVLIMETDHTCSIINVIDWAKKQGHDVDYAEISDGEWEIYIEKSR
ncbi:sulfurtransferase TusA family protein [Serpentinicella alkaliphila]|uniref:TusA-related sulfurtransferase n=1 Tax=Serpentinicella alkaliphila TaxID=1734049 RepID=A0A4R2TIL2_9FIRM|nr:sulfurtransferase TusA family protein [Serpentinicella alkaliphila]QUH24599.1 sulfurtransferase TusA family protein [Serpentinicella alkaliphila]TCQ02596.1 TusA-related sulfurtransferase [Serpentinicella alkaliphila]